MIRKLNLKLSPGRVTAVVGDSGAGKSTLTHLLMRLYDPCEGAIFVDDFNLKELDLATYHRFGLNFLPGLLSTPRFIAVVNQNPLLFNTSIGENIAYGAPDREVSEKGDFLMTWSLVKQQQNPCQRLSRRPNWQMLTTLSLPSVGATIP